MRDEDEQVKVRSMNSLLRICIDTAEDPRVIALLDAHLALMRSSSPPESVFALDLEGLRASDITFWTIWQGEEVISSGALKAHSATLGEIKSMHTLAAHRGKGAGAKMLEHIMQEARSRGYTRLNLETGSTDVFLPAQRLYQRYGFTFCEAFPPYKPNPFSVFMTCEL